MGENCYNLEMLLAVFGKRNKVLVKTQFIDNAAFFHKSVGTNLDFHFSVDSREKKMVSKPDIFICIKYLLHKCGRP